MIFKPFSVTPVAGPVAAAVMRAPVQVPPVVVPVARLRFGYGPFEVAPGIAPPTRRLVHAGRPYELRRDHRAEATAAAVTLAAAAVTAKAMASKPRAREEFLARTSTVPPGERAAAEQEQRDDVDDEADPTETLAQAD